MSFRKEVMDQFKTLNYAIIKLHQTVKINDARVVILNEQIMRLQKEKESLLDRLMSRNFEEFKTYSVDKENVELLEDLLPENDETSAGEVIG